MGEVLSQSEIDNLLAALTTGELDVDQMQENAEKQTAGSPLPCLARRQTRNELVAPPAAARHKRADIRHFGNKNTGDKKLDALHGPAGR